MRQFNEVKPDGEPYRPTTPDKVSFEVELGPGDGCRGWERLLEPHRLYLYVCCFFLIFIFFACGVEIAHGLWRCPILSKGSRILNIMGREAMQTQ